MDRKTKIVELVNMNGKVSVKDLADDLDTSEVTIRKELTDLDQKGLIKREHGYAIKLDNNRIDTRIGINYGLKKSIASLAAESISDGETLMIESGSTNALLAEAIGKYKKNVTIITNSTYIANYLNAYKDIKVILLGGFYQRESQVNTGPLTKWCAEKFVVDKIFVGVDGYDEKFGFSVIDLERAQTVRDMAKSAKRICVITDSSKFREKSTVNLFSFDEVAYVYTDASISQEVKENLEKNKIRVKTYKK
ncbi:MAG: DeoR/GlpR family DNA-binding transcription regulator [Peptoniphilaceae bacterium]|nr:DeoR/GlpR family DNA-binding transcription regulator [Peptoniphilaceae bacterium]MDY6018958.1 DeoR/GlpR family DNA-binding transcription regulator [Anaerococcus sp.]